MIELKRRSVVFMVLAAAVIQLGRPPAYLLLSAHPAGCPLPAPCSMSPHSPGPFLLSRCETKLRSWTHFALLLLAGEYMKSPSTPADGGVFHTVLCGVCSRAPDV